MLGLLWTQETTVGILATGKVEVFKPDIEEGFWDWPSSLEDLVIAFFSLDLTYDEKI